MLGPTRGADRRDHTHTRAFSKHLQASLNTTCPACEGTLNITRARHTKQRAKHALEQDCRCLHCDVAFTRVLPIPQPNRTWEVLTGVSALLFSSARVQLTRAVEAIRVLARPEQ